MAVQSAPSPYTQREGTMNLVPVSHVLNEFKSIYESELSGRARIFTLDPKTAATQVAQKVFTYCLLTYLNRVDAKMGVFGRSYFLPAEPYYSENPRTCGVSRMHTGFVEIPGLGAFVVDLGSAKKMTVSTTDGDTEIYEFKGEGFPIRPLAGIERIKHWITSNDIFIMEPENFPTKYRDASYNPPADWKVMLRELSQQISVLATDHLKQIENAGVVLTPVISEALSRICLIPTIKLEEIM